MKPRPSRRPPVDRTSPIPLYFQIAENLKEAIQAGSIAPGERLDNELGLAGRLGVSPPTVRPAIQRLVHEGLGGRRRGPGHPGRAPRPPPPAAPTPPYDAPAPAPPRPD